MSLAMSNDEIVVRYKQAKDKGEQVKILAELNDCPVERIIGILTANGVDNRCFNHLRGKLKKTHNYTPNISQEDKQKIFEESLEQQRKQEQQVKIPYKKPEIIPAPPEKKESAAPAEEHTPEVPKAVIAAVEDKITELQYMINQNKDTVKSLLQHNEKFSDRIGILTAWLEEVKK
jgi:hypothetical protein